MISRTQNMGIVPTLSGWDIQAPPGQIPGCYLYQFTSPSWLTVLQSLTPMGALCPAVISDAALAVLLLTTSHGSRRPLLDTVQIEGLFFFLAVWGVELRALHLLEQSLYHLSQASNPFCFGYF
jgi:hypothetical protein